MTKHVKSKKLSTECCNNAVSAALPLTQKNSLVAPRVYPVKKTYRRSAVSRTIRVPNELVSRVNDLIAAYRKQLRNEPDMWDC